MDLPQLRLALPMEIVAQTLYLLLSGDVVEFNFVSGNWDTEITFQVYDPSGSQILNIGPFATNDGNDSFLLTDTSNSTCLPQNVSVTFSM